MQAEFKPSEHPAIPDRTYVHCLNKACDVSCSTDDLASFNVEKYDAPFYTAASFAAMEASGQPQAAGAR